MEKSRKNFHFTRRWTSFCSIFARYVQVENTTYSWMRDLAQPTRHIPVEISRFFKPRLMNGTTETWQSTDVKVEVTISHLLTLGWPGWEKLLRCPWDIDHRPTNIRHVHHGRLPFCCQLTERWDVSWDGGKNKTRGFSARLLFHEVFHEVADSSSEAPKGMRASLGIPDSWCLYLHNAVASKIVGEEFPQLIPCRSAIFCNSQR